MPKFAFGIFPEGMEKEDLIEKRIEAFCGLGEYLERAESDPGWRNVVEKACAVNGFFTPENIGRAVTQWAAMLKEENLRAWLSPYMDRLQEVKKPGKIALVMAGNIPLVGFHDYLCVLMCGYSAQVKLSSKDAFLLPFLDRKAGIPAQTEFTQGNISGFDAVIATGSGNTFRYFDYYFGKYPHLLRKNRTSCAVLDGKESRRELERLADDMFSYFGLGCRNVSKLYLPEGYDVAALADVLAPYTRKLALNNSYKNNYDYYKSIYLVNRRPHLDTGAALLTESGQLASPMAVAYYEYYRDAESLRAVLEACREEIQCIVGRGGLPFGTAQSPGLSDWADGEDVLDFLLSV